MNGIATFLSERVESLLPRAAVAACVPNSPWCSTVHERLHCLLPQELSPKLPR
jgi:hypothetical protein